MEEDEPIGVEVWQSGRVCEGTWRGDSGVGGSGGKENAVVARVGAGDRGAGEEVGVGEELGGGEEGRGPREEEEEEETQDRASKEELEDPLEVGKGN